MTIQRKKSTILIAVIVFTLSKTCTSAYFFPDEKEEELSTFDNIFESIKTFTNSVTRSLKEIAQNADKLIKFARFASKFVESTIEEECIYECPGTGDVPVPNPKHVHAANGCGALGFSVAPEELPLPVMSLCCDVHDACYDTCGKDKELCDKEFQRCLYRVCSDDQQRRVDRIAHTKCKTGAKLLYTSTITLGCQPYKEAQKEACLCIKNTNYRRQYETGEKYKNEL